MSLATSAAPGATRPLAAIGIALLFAFGLLCLVSAEPVSALRQLLTGALPEPHWSADGGLSWRRLGRFGAVLQQTTTLTLLGLAMLIGLRARQFSMGADGQWMLAALAALAVGVWLPPLGGLSWLVAAAAAALVGFAWGLLPGLLKARFAANEIVTTLMLNIVALQLFRWIVTQGFNDPAAGFLATPALAVAALPPRLPGSEASVLLLLIVLAPLAAGWLLQRTTLGYEIRVVGDSAPFAAQAGLPVARTIVLSMALGGVFAGLAGLQVSHGLLGRLPADLPPGIGYQGLVIALLAGNQPQRVPLAAFGYALLEGGAQAMERASDVPREMVLVVQAVVVLLVVCERLLPARKATHKAAP
ncbi:ABC transporter permease [Aquincola sp. S2]|uniref:ABC transporter permease n=1 Tax=Pseudaquabacterium terrae TaxID=2732868 RepID=A0ABX2EMA1_9BURK|nr:ABC transporter permease [Aquabacterium terrae]NRF69780.1 ABC transporter permease [Aquabacterium terrae]